VLDDVPPSEFPPLVLSHNHVNPSNLVYDGQDILLLDWDAAGANDPFYDLAAASVFLRMDELTCRKLLASYDDKPIAPLPARFAYNRRLVAVLCGAMFLRLALQSRYPGATGEETLASTPALGEVYSRLRSGSLTMATGEGQWWFGLALLKASCE
jgi:aminoglycoside phosphotransferase (APT) family kinase protein